MSVFTTSRSRLFDDVADALLARIRKGEYTAGDRLPPERKLVEEFGVSRTAVREALRLLAARGLVDSHVGRGTFVRQPTPRHLAEVLSLTLGNAGSPDAVRQARGMLEGELAHRAASADEATREALADTAKGRDDDYFTALAGAAGMPALGPVIAALSMLENARSSSGSPALVKALRSGDAEGAREAVSIKPARVKTPAEMG